MTSEPSRLGHVAVWIFALSLTVAGCQPPAEETGPGGTVSTSPLQLELSDAQVEDIVRRSWQYVAMYNVNNKFAMDPTNPLSTGGWNRIKANTALADHTLKAIPRPNNDTL